jgi:hypothetical protein
MSASPLKRTLGGTMEAIGWRLWARFADL